MAINYNAMADFDPMGAMAEYKFKADKAAREKADWELAHKAKQQAWSDNQNLRALAEQLQAGKQVPTEVQTGEMANMGPPVPPQSLRDLAPTMQAENTAKDFGGGSPLKFTSTAPNPQYAAAMKAYGDQVKSAPQTVPLMETQMKNVPYTTGEKSQKFAEQLLKQGDIAGALKATESVLKLDEAMPKHMTDMHKLVNQEAMSELSAGTPPDQVGKSIAAKYRMAGNEAAASLAENSKFLPNGVMVTPAPGGTVMTKYTADGGYSIDYHKADKAQTGKYPALPEIRVVDGKKMEGQFIFSTPEQVAEYERTKIPRGGNWENSFGDKSTTVVVNPNSTGTVRQAKDLPAGYVTVTRGPNAGQIMKVDFDKNGRQITRPITKEENAALGMTASDYKWNQDMPREKQVAMIEAVRPRIKTLAEQFKNLNNKDIKIVNKAKNFLKDEFGWKETADFNSNAKTAVLELTRALSGAGAMSDSRVKMELSNLDNSASPEQFAANINNVLAALDSYEKAFKKRAPAGAGGKAETRTYKGKTYKLKPGADRTKQESWEVQ